MVPDVAGEATSHEALSRGLASTWGWGAMGSHGQFQEARSEPTGRGAGLAWGGGQHDPTVPCSTQPQFVRFTVSPSHAAQPRSVSPDTPSSKPELGQRE